MGFCPQEVGAWEGLCCQVAELWEEGSGCTASGMTRKINQTFSRSLQVQSLKPPKAALEVQAESVGWESRIPTKMKAGSWWLLAPEAWLLLPLQICY